jgi:hypothetical protein
MKLVCKEFAHQKFSINGQDIEADKKGIIEIEMVEENSDILLILKSSGFVELLEEPELSHEEIVEESIEAALEENPKPKRKYKKKV